MKNKLKDLMLQKRNSLTKEEILEKSTDIERNLLKLEVYTKSKTAMFFVSFNNEVHTHSMIKEALKKKTVVVPKVINREIEPSVIIDFENLISSEKFGILEPIDIMKIAYKKIDLVFVPGIVFDEAGHRIGYGYGYYDKFLRKTPKSVKIGLAFDFQIIDRIPNEEHDVAVDFIVTEKRLIICFASSSSSRNIPQSR